MAPLETFSFTVGEAIFEASLYDTFRGSPATPPIAGHERSAEMIAISRATWEAWKAAGADDQDHRGD